MEDRRKHLYKMFFPKSIAVIGASSDMSQHAGAMLARSIEFGYKGKIYPINPKREEVFGKKCYKRISDVPEIPDVVFIMIRAEYALKVIDECGRVGVKNIVIISAGFKEVGGDGVKREQELGVLVAKYGLNVVGPNGPGFLSNSVYPNENGLHCMMSTEETVSGGIVIVSQSGGITAALVDFAKRLGAGCRLIVGVGNKADVNEVDIMEAMIEDEKFLDGVKVIALYQESVSDGDRLIEVTRKFKAKRIPVITYKAGKTEFGQKAASSHTGAMATSDVAVNALFEKAGIIRVSQSEDLLNLACSFDKVPLPMGKRVAIVTGSGGPAVIASDALKKYGLELAKFSEGTQGKIDSILSGHSSFCSSANPIDIIGGSGTGEIFQRVVETILRSEDADMVLITMPNTPFEGGLSQLAHSLTVSHTVNMDEPMFVVTMANVTTELRGRYHRGNLPILLFPEKAVKVMSYMCKYKDILNVFEGVRDEYYEFDDIKFAMGLPSEVGWLSQKTVKEVMKVCEIETPKDIKVLKSSKDTQRFFSKCMVRRMNRKNTDFDFSKGAFLKIDSNDIVHKSDAGCVEKSSLATLILDYESIMKNAKKHYPDAKIDGVLVEEMVKLHGSKEVLIGVKYEPGIGHLIGFGEGGTYANARNDIKFALAPLTIVEARGLIFSVDFYEILRGFRGEESVNIELLVEILLKISQLTQKYPQIRELDINPLIVNSEKAVAVDVRIRVK